MWWTPTGVYHPYTSTSVNHVHLRLRIPPRIPPRTPPTYIRALSPVHTPHSTHRRILRIPPTAYTSTYTSPYVYAVYHPQAYTSYTSTYTSVYVCTYINPGRTHASRSPSLSPSLVLQKSFSTSRRVVVGRTQSVVN